MRKKETYGKKMSNQHFINYESLNGVIDFFCSMHKYTSFPVGAGDFCTFSLPNF